MGLNRHCKYPNCFGAGTVFKTSESDVFSRQILTSKGGPRDEWATLAVCASDV